MNAVQIRRSADPHPKILELHRKRLAVIYVRQSSLYQVENHLESQKRQYQLTDHAQYLGWAEASCVVIDEDLGISGAQSFNRPGYQRLVSMVALREVGIVFGLEISRLARNSLDWYQLLELAAAFDVLIADEDGVYNPAEFNDRLLLGLKGTMSEAELFVLRARLQGGILNKARRGALKLILPIGLCYSEANTIVLDPNLQVQATIREVFRSFQATGSTFATVRHFHQQRLLFPRRLRRGPHQGELLWAPIEHHDVLRMLHNPAYAGAYVYGRTHPIKTANGKVSIEYLPRSDWIALVKGAASYSRKSRCSSSSNKL
jgi:DNA invertase Pin-like site-specific DNA recombinase